MHRGSDECLQMTWTQLLQHTLVLLAVLCTSTLVECRVWMRRDVDLLKETRNLGKRIELTISLIETETEGERDVQKLPVRVPVGDWTKKCDKKCRKSKRVRTLLHKKRSKLKGTAVPDKFPDPDRIHDQKSQ